MATSVRLIKPDEVDDWLRSVSVPFLRPISVASDRDEWRRHWGPHLELDRTWALDDDGRIVGNACVFSRSVTLPASPGAGNPVVPMAAVSAVGVHPTHRRRGHLRRLMAAMLDDARERGEAVAGLLASESVIYGRFGFGVATHAARYAIDARSSAFAVPAAPVTVRLLTGSEAADVLPALFERIGAGQPGQVSRPEVWWEQVFEDWTERRKGAGPLFYAVCEGGFAVWRAEETEEGNRSRVRLLVRDLHGETAEIEAALWRFVLDVDLVDEVLIYPAKPEEPLRHRLADPRQLRTESVTDFLWLRVLDVSAALSTRGYRQAARLVLDVVAPAATPTGPDGLDGPDPAVGRWTLDADPEGASCRPATAGEPTDLRLGVADLGSLLLGGERASVLAAAGRIAEERPGALDRADGLFASRPAPWCATSF